MERHTRKRSSPNQPQWLRWLHNQTQPNQRSEGLEINQEMISREKRLKLIRRDLTLKIDPKRKAQMRWLEQWDIDSIYSENIDLANSQAALGIPLVDVAVGPGLHIALSMSYTSGDVSTNGPLGNGWNLHNAAQDFIVVDHKQSSFSRNHGYQLSVEGQLMKLIPSKDSTDQFTLENEPEVNVTYLKTLNRWIIDTPNMRTVYGASENTTIVPDALQWSLHWPHWRGPGTDEASLEQEVISWYMVSREEKHALKRKLYYKYVTENRSISTGKTFTSVIQLESVYDSEKKSVLNLIYDQKDNQEYFVKVYKDKQGTIQFPIHLLKSLYLVGYHLETDGYQQQLQFDYEVEPNGTRKLLGISQIFNENGGKMGEQEKIFNFKYQPFPAQKYLLSEVEIPTYHSSLHYSYENLQIPLLRFDNESLNTKRIPVVSNVQIYQGEDFGTLSYDLGNGGIYVEVYNKQFTLFIAQMTTKTGSYLEGEDGEEEDPKKIKRFATLLYPNLVAVLEETGEEKRLNLFTRDAETKQWPGSPSRTIRIAKDAVFRYTDKLMVVSRNEVGSLGKLLVIQPNVGKDDQEEGKDDQGYREFELGLSNGGGYRVDRLVVQDDVILAYNGQRLHGWRENEKVEGDWVETVIYQVHSEEEEFFNMFEANKDFLGSIREQMNVTGLHMTDNMILLTALDWNKDRAEIRTNAHLILVNDQLDKVSENVRQVGIENVLTMEKEEAPSDRMNMTFRYEWNGNKTKFRVKLHDLRGEELEEMCKEADDKGKCKQEIIKEYNEMDSFRDQIKEMMLFDFEKYFTFQLEPSGASTKDTKYEMTGNGWAEKEINEKGVIKLGSGFILETVENKTESETSYSLYRQNVEDGGIKGGKIGEWRLHNQRSGMSVGYPSYLAMQPDVMYQPELVVLREEGEEIGNIRLGEQGEQILRMSNHETLFTLINSTDPVFPSHDKKLIVRRVNSVVPSSPMWALVKTEVRYGKESRVRGYENQFNCRGDKIAQENIVRVIPQNDKGYSGYYEEITVVPIEAPQNSTKSQNWYDVNDELVLTKDVEAALEQHGGQEEEDGGKWNKILDFSGHLEISDISPYNITNQEVAYLGFEPYENNTLPFEFVQSSVISSKDVPLTGTNMLRVRNGESFKGSLTPANQQATYVASTWLKFPSEVAPQYEFDSPLEYFKANLKTHTGHQLMGVYAQMKRQQRDWIFAEISLDLDKIRNNVYSEFYRYSDQASNLPPPSTTNFTISLEISGEKIKEDLWIDVDHVRFAPINLDWTVNVFDPRTALETEQILSGGGILRKIYNQFSTEIGTVDESGQVEQFKSLSRSGFIFPPPTSDSQLGIQEYRREVVVIPEQGYHEKFDEFSLLNLWTLEGQTETGSWERSKGRLTHLVEGTHQLTLNKVDTLFDPVSSAIRLHVHFASTQASLTISLNGLEDFIVLQGNGTLNISSGCKIIQNLPSSGELFFHINQDAVWLWFDGVLLLDRKLDRSCVGGPVSMLPWQTFKMEMKGEQTISDIITIQNPEISLEFFNAWGERTQVVQLETSDSALVSETIYDEMGRDAIKTKAVRITRSENYSPLLIYYSDFVRNRYPSEASSVFKTGTVQGLASDLNPEDEGFPYSRTLYQNDMLREISEEGMPGKTFSTFGTFTKRHGRSSGIPFLQILFPFQNNFREKVTYEPNGTLRVSVLDSKQNEVAIYVKVSGYDNILTIFEYDDQGKLVKMLPPKYHDHMRTHLRTKPWNFGEENLTEEEKYWQSVYGTHYQYDDQDQLILKMAPDHKTKGFLYDTMGNIRFMYTLPSVSSLNATSILMTQYENQVAEDIVYMLHVGQNKPVEIGYFNDPINVGLLKSFQNGTEIPSLRDSQLHQRIVYSESHSDPDIRGKVRLFLTYDSADIETASGGKGDGSSAPPHQELLRFGSSNQVVMKTSNAVHTDTFTNYQKHYKGNKLREMAYPRGRYARNSAANETVFNLIHSYDKMGRLEGLGTRTDSTTFAKIAYNPAGQVDQEMIEPGTFSNSSRRFEYNSPGLLTRIVDPYLSQSISFIDGGYGQSGIGDGIAMNNVMSSTWSGIDQLNEIQRKWFSISEEAFENDKEIKKCLQALRRVGVLDEDTNIPLKFLTKSLLSLLPLSCSGEMGLRLMNLIAQHLPPTSNYGHSYSYGNHQELTKAKFFGDGEKESKVGPLRYLTFLEEIPEISSPEEAEVIWDLLTRNQYLLVDNGNAEDKAAAIGKEGTKGLFRFSILAQDLKQVDEAFDVFSEPILKMLYKNILEGNGEMIGLGDFQNTFVNWHGYYDTPTANLIINRARESAEKIYNMLGDKGWMSGDLEGLLSEDYLEVLKNHRSLVSQITGCLVTHFSAQMGTNIYDFESYYIDPNGNRLMFYQGLNRYELEYEGATNHVKKLTVRDPYGGDGNGGGGDKVTTFEHDNQGNVNKAGHKDIQLIKYHPVTNRPVLIVLGDGRRILLKYDAQGERLLKRVFAPEGSNKLLSETKYLRDENGRVLMDKLTRFGENGEIEEELESTYLYGPRDTILGFYRNGKYYNVFTDHAGSTRLITHMGEVVAGYDYWPYGEMIRVFGERGAHLAYRFTGQEYDEETGLYNYHARLYDPTIGRFFQPDPKSQYYSPYVYGGNSPVSLVDPDGEFFLLLFAVIGAIVGGYLAGAAANGSFNPLKWNWKSANTWLAILGGAVGGAALPGSILTAVGSIGVLPTLLVGLGGSYLKMVQANGSWNPGDWDWSNPATYNAFLEGFGSAVQMAPGAKENLLNAKKYLASMSKTGQKLIVEVASGVGVALIKGAFENEGNFKFWEWDWSDPATWSSVKDGFMLGKGLPEKAGKAYKGFADMSKNTNWKSTLKSMRGSTKTFMKGVFKNPKHPLWKTMGKAVISYIATGMDQGTLDFTKWDWHSKSTYEGLMNNYKIATELKTMAEQFRQGEWKDGFKDIFEKEIEKRLVAAFPQLQKIFDGVDKLWEYYGPESELMKGKGQGDRMRIPVAMKMWLELNEGLILSKAGEGDDGTEFEKEMQGILGGLRAGLTIYIEGSGGDIGSLIDCQSGKESDEFERCVIGGISQGLVGRMNREFSKNVFLRSNLYQSKNGFVKVEMLRGKAEEYSEEILGIFGSEKERRDELFYGSFFIGSIFHSLLNAQNSTRKKSEVSPPKLYFKQENIADVNDVMVTHIAMLVEKQNRRILHVRSLFALDAATFAQLEDKLVDYLKQMRFGCYLPDNMITVDEVQAESVVITAKDLGGSDVYVITPDYHVDLCESHDIGEKFIEIPQPTGETIYENLSKYLDKSVETMEEKEKLYENLLKILFDVSNQANSLLPTISAVPFIYGLLHSNDKQTYEMALKIDKFSQSILFVPKRNSKGQQTWHGIPSIISIKPGLYHNFLHKSAVISLTKQALIGVVSDETIETNPAMLPKFTGILNRLGDSIDPLAIEDAVRYIYYNNRIASSTIALPSTQENFHFVSNFILGEFISQIEHSSFEVFVLAPVTNQEDQQRLKAQRLFFLRDPENGSCTILNIIESSMQTGPEYEFDPNVPKDIPSVPDVEISHLQMIQINLNPNSVDGWSSEEDDTNKPTEKYFWQSVKVTTEDHRFLTRDPNAYLKLEIPVNSTPAFSFSRDFIADMFSKLKENRLQLLINVDSDLQSVVMGILMGASTLVGPNIDGITTTLRNFITDENPGLPDNIPTKLSILSVAKEGVVIPQTEQVLLANLKSISTEGNESHVIEATMKEATDELKIYQCSREEKLKEAFKVCSVPAVYDSNELPQDPDGQRVYFEVDPETLSESNCTAAENPFREFLKTHRNSQREDDMKKTGFLEKITAKFTQYVYGNQNPENGQTKPVDTHIEKCHLGAWTDGQYSTDGITCSSGKSRIAVFRNIEPNDLVRTTSRGDPFHLVGDNYKNEECTPISFNGRGSVACKGEKSTLIYTPYFEPRLFDELDGNLMLGRVVMHMGGKLWSFVRRENVTVVEEDYLVTNELVGLWENDIRDIRAMLGKWEGDGGEIDWVKENLEECREMIGDIELNDFNVKPERIEIITERLAALKEDFSEQILFTKTENMFGDKADGHWKEFGEESRNSYYGGAPSASAFGNSGVGMGHVNGGSGLAQGN